MKITFNPLSGNFDYVLSEIDISEDTNLAAISPIVLTDDTLSFAYNETNTWTADNIFQADAYFAEKIVHEGDTDTYISFTNNAMNFYVGGTRVIDFNSQFGVETLNLTADSIKLDGQTLATNKVKFTQTDGNEYVDSLTDGELDAEATTSINLRINKSEQLQVFDGRLSPAQTNDIDLGDSSHFFKDVYIVGEAKGSLVSIGVGGQNSAAISTGYTKTINGMVMSANKGFVMPCAGSITKLGVSCYISVATPDASAIFHVYKNGSSVFSVSVSATDGTGWKTLYDTQARGTDTFVAGDVISFYVQESIGVGGAIDVDYPLFEVWGYFDE